MWDTVLPLWGVSMSSLLLGVGLNGGAVNEGDGRLGG